MAQHSARPQRSKGAPGTEQSTPPGTIQEHSDGTPLQPKRDSFIQYLDDLKSQFEADRKTLDQDYEPDKLHGLVEKYTTLGDTHSSFIDSPRTAHYKAINQTEDCITTAGLIRNHIYELARFFENSRRKQPAYSFVTARQIITNILNAIDKCWTAYSETLLGP